MPHFHTPSNKNFGFGRQMNFAGRNALQTVMPGQFHTIASHAERWKQFCAWAKTQDVKETHQVNNHTLRNYAEYLRARLEGQGKPLSVATAQNRLSTCNVVLKAMRGNDDIRIRPAEALQSNRQKIRTDAPELSRDKLAQAQAELIETGYERIAAVLGLCRELGLRSREAVLLDCQKTLLQHKECGEVDIELGTKGGRGKSTATSPSRAARWVPVPDTALAALTQAARLQGEGKNLVPPGKRLEHFLALVRVHSGAVLKKQGLKHRHDLRAAFSCDQYKRLTGQPAPVISDLSQLEKRQDRQARQEIAYMLGHHRGDVMAAYLGSVTFHPKDTSS